mmetsp:Transcript_1891/g.4437  ORF Transcript_1891/g.4437 Transcript_1891/m.4437 type:complete len:276 (+) Transcript_1891:157-984(+)
MCFPSDDQSADARVAAAAAVFSTLKVPVGKSQDRNDHELRFRSVLKELVVVTAARQAPPTSQNDTVFLFDWDDTLFGTTHLEQLGYMDIINVSQPDDAPRSPLSILAPASLDDLAAQLQQLDYLAAEVLARAAQRGRVVIVTNAGDGWVQISSERFLPRVKAVLDSFTIRIVSARGRYFDDFPDTPCEWKVHAFADELRGAKERNIIVLGDSVSDQYAAHKATADAGPPNMLLKFVKFAERPTVRHLHRQLSVARDSIDEIVQHNSSFDVNVVAC